MPVAYDPEKLSELVSGADAAVAVFDYAMQNLNNLLVDGLTTASVYDLGEMRSRRVYSEDMNAYPVGNFKRLDRNRYFDTVIEGKNAFSTTTIEEIAEVFFDWEKIRDLGFESNLNIPAVANGEVIGTANLLGPKGRFDAATVRAALAWQPVITTAFLLLHAGDIESATLHRGLVVDEPLQKEGM